MRSLDWWALAYVLCILSGAAAVFGVLVYSALVDSTLAFALLLTVPYWAHTIKVGVDGLLELGKVRALSRMHLTIAVVAAADTTDVYVNDAPVLRLRHLRPEPGDQGARLLDDISKALEERRKS